MKKKIVKIITVVLFSFTALVFLGSIPMPQQNPKENKNIEARKLQNSINKHLEINVSRLSEKNPAILLEISVE